MMMLIPDNQIIKIASEKDPAKIREVLAPHVGQPIVFRWPSLLQFLGLETLFDNLPPFDQDQPLFKACLATLHDNEDKSVAQYVYDRLFAEILTQVQALPQLHPSFLLQAIAKKQEGLPTELQSMFSISLTAYREAFANNPAPTIHDLVLYLAWDRMCISLARLFSYQSTDLKFLNSLGVLKECLIESYQHIKEHKRTSPSFYRLVEALFFYQMREENLEKHAEADWALLSRSFPILKDENALADIFYIDDVIVMGEEEQSIHYLTLEPVERVNARVALAQYMVDQLKKEVPEWKYAIRDSKSVISKIIFRGL